MEAYGSDAITPTGINTRKSSLNIVDSFRLFKIIGIATKDDHCAIVEFHDQVDTRPSGNERINFPIAFMQLTSQVFTSPYCRHRSGIAIQHDCTGVSRSFDRQRENSELSVLLGGERSLKNIARGRCDGHHNEQNTAHKNHNFHHLPDLQVTFRACPTPPKPCYTTRRVVGIITGFVHATSAGNQPERPGTDIAKIMAKASNSN